jgi:hypothetical protein
MSQTVDAVYDGTVLRPDVALPLEPNTRVRLVVEVLTAPERPSSFLDTALSLNLSGPPDWSAKLDEYLYGDADRPQ